MGAASARLLLGAISIEQSHQEEQCPGQDRQNDDDARDSNAGAIASPASIAAHRVHLEIEHF